MKRKSASSPVMRSLSWKAKRDGDIYCSPACGAFCTYENYLTAKKKAKCLANKLGAGWKPVVSENLGWYWRAVKGTIKVFGESSDGGTYDSRFWALIGQSATDGGMWTGIGKTPRSAVLNAIENAQSEVEFKTKILVAATKALSR